MKEGDRSLGRAEHCSLDHSPEVLCVCVTVRFKIYGCFRQSSFRGFFRLKKKKIRGTRRQTDHVVRPK